MSHKKKHHETPQEDIIDIPDVTMDDAVGYTDEGAVPAPAQAASTENLSADELKAKLEQVQKDYLYLRADYDNYRRQAIKERSSLARYAGEKLAKDILDTLDIFDKVLSAEVTPENYKDFAQGIELTAQNLRGTLNKHGINEVPALGEPFDPSIHEALASEPTDKVPEGHVSQVFKKPYKYHDKVLRTGQVVVAKPLE